MKHQQIIGVDVSKLTLDVCIKPTGLTLRISNDPAGFKQLKSKVVNWENTLIVMEHTGPYSCRFENFLFQQDLRFCKVPALQIKRSLGLVRGKSDKLDAGRIADYGWLRRDQLEPDAPVDPHITELRSLLSLRAKMVRERSGYKTRFRESLKTGEYTATSFVARMQARAIKARDREIKQLEAEIRRLIQANKALSQNYHLVQNIEGVGHVIAAQMVVYTHNFTRFKNARKFNCYAGLAPFDHQSGTSIRKRSRVSHLANKELKTLLNLGANAAVRTKSELQDYYKRRLSEGMRKLACLNIIRSKIVARIFAVVKRQSPYEPIAA